MYLIDVTNKQSLEMKLKYYLHLRRIISLETPDRLLMFYCELDQEGFIVFN